MLIPIVLFQGYAFANTGNQQIEFNSYKVDLYKGERSKLTEEVSAMALDANINLYPLVFAGKYAEVPTSCGTGCIGSILVNVSTGQSLNKDDVSTDSATECTNGGKSFEKYKKNSRLYIIRGGNMIKDKNNAYAFNLKGHCEQHYYLEDNGRLEKLK